MPLQDDEYRQFLERSRDKIAVMIIEAKVKVLFAKDMDKRERDFKKYKAAAEQILQFKKSERKGYIEWAQNTPDGRSHIRKLRKWEDDWRAYEKGLTDKHLGREPIADFKWRKDDIHCVDPLAKFQIPMKPEQFETDDYRVLLGVIHDGLTKDRGDLPDYICPKLWGTKTFQFDLYIMVKNNVEYQTLIKKALRCVENDLREKELLGEVRENLDIADYKRESKTPPGTHEVKKKAGRPNTTELEAQKRRQLKTEWEKARDFTKSKSNFCDDNGITVEYLNNCALRWCRDHPR